ncbi:MAG: tail fiber protein [Betaproteobacteria bacterium]|nr:tail fiber protein [Betaproteobacteria bacterium]
MISVQGSFPSQECCTGLADTALGEVVAFAGGAAPEGWMLADGRLLFISQYQALFALLGTTFGGDGRVTFALPDLRGRTLVGSDERIRIGEQFGTEYASLFLANLPAHAHTLPVPEPGTWWLLFAGLMVMVPVAARRVH